MGVALTATTNILTLQDPTSDVRVNFDTQFEATMADALVRPVESVDVVDVTIAIRRALVEARRLGTSVNVDFDLLPYGGPNVVADTTLQSSTTSANGNSLFTISSLVSSTITTNCGNGVCETGERPSVTNAGCPVDCPYPVLTCPVANGLACNNRGACVTVPTGSTLNTAYSGRCECLSGYSGESCSACADSFVMATEPAGMCVRLQSLTTVPPKTSSSSKPSAGMVAGVVVAVLVIVGVVAGVVYIRRLKRELHSAKNAEKSAKKEAKEAKKAAETAAMAAARAEAGYVGAENPMWTVPSTSGRGKFAGKGASVANSPEAFSPVSARPLY